MIIFFFLFPLMALADNTAVETFMERPLIDPAVDERCKELMALYDEKKDMRLKNDELSLRVENLLKLNQKSPREEAKKTLKNSQEKLKLEQDKLKESTAKLEETIIRSGCPGINFK